MKKLRCLAAVLAAGLMISTFGMQVSAARIGTITTDGARVRADADANAQKVCSLPVETNVDITDEKESGGKTWYQISFTLDGAQKTGWIRSDLLSVSETADPEEPAAEEPQEETPAAAYTIQEPEESYSDAELTETSIQVGDTSYTAYQADSELYLVWAQKADGSTGWYWYDPQENTFQRDLGQFAGAGESAGLTESLTNELTELKETSASSLKTRLYIIIGLAVLSAILLILTIVFALKSRNAGYEYEDDDYDDYDGDEEDDFDDFYDDLKKGGKRRAEKEKPDLSLTDSLPEIDMSALETAEAAKLEDEVPVEPEPRKEPVETGDDIDIEILDLEDLEL